MGKGRAIPQNAIPVISNTMNTPHPMGQMPAQQANRPNLTVTANPQPYSATVSKKQQFLARIIVLHKRKAILIKIAQQSFR